MAFSIKGFQAWLSNGPPSEFTVTSDDMKGLASSQMAYLARVMTSIDKGELFGVSWTSTNDARGYVFTKTIHSAPGPKGMPADDGDGDGDGDGKLVAGGMVKVYAGGGGGGSNVYESGAPDKRVDPTILTPTRFRPRYRKLLPDEVVLHDEIKATAENLEQLFEKIPNAGRYKALALTALEESIMWAVKDLTK